MPRNWSKTDAFASFGVRLRNPQWSWSGQSDDHRTVAVVLWQDGVKGRNGQLTYADFGEPDAEWRQRLGAKARIEDLILCRDELDGRFRAVIAVAVDRDADPRQIKTCHPQPSAWWRLDEFNPVTGEFSAHVERE